MPHKPPTEPAPPDRRPRAAHIRADKQRKAACANRDMPWPTGRRPPGNQIVATALRRQLRGRQNLGLAYVASKPTPAVVRSSPAGAPRGSVGGGGRGGRIERFPAPSPGGVERPHRASASRLGRPGLQAVVLRRDEHHSRGEHGLAEVRAGGDGPEHGAGRGIGQGEYLRLGLATGEVDGGGDDAGAVHGGRTVGGARGEGGPAPGGGGGRGGPP